MQKRIGDTDLDWDDLRLFLAIHRARTLTGAARLLQIDQSTVSRRLLALERLLGLPLFDRLPGGLEATALGDRLLPVAELAEAAAQDFVREVSSAQQEVGGVVRVAVPEGIDSQLLIPALPELLAAHPQLMLELIASPQLANLVRREADLALRFVRPRVGELVARKVATMVQGVWVHERFRAQPPPLLQSLPWIGWDEGLETEENIWQERTISPAQLRLRCNRIEAKLAAVKAGVGAAILPDALAHQHPGLIRLEVPGLAMAADVWLVGHKGLMAVPRIRAVWQFLLEQTERYLH